MKRFISVVICAHNEEKGIAKCIEGVKNQTYPKVKYEIIVVDNASSDKTAEVAKDLGARVVFEKNKGIAYARQKGAESARGEVITFTDADTLVPKNWLEKIANAFEKDEKLVGFGGTYKITSGSFISKFFINNGMYYLYLLGRLATGGWVLIGPNMAFRKSAFEKTKGFDTSVMQGEDIDISQKLQKIGKVKLENKFFVYQSGRRFEKGFIKGLLSYGLSWPMKVFFHKDSNKQLKDFR